MLIPHRTLRRPSVSEKLPAGESQLRNCAHDRLVMAGLVPAIHAFDLGDAVKTWMPGTRPGMTKD